MSVKKLKCPCCLNESLYWSLDATVIVDAYTSDDEGRPLVALGNFERREIASYLDEGYSLECSSAGCYFSMDESGTSGLETYEEYSEELLDEVQAVWDQSREIHTCDEELREQEPHNFDVTVSIGLMVKSESEEPTAHEVKRALKRLLVLMDGWSEEQILMGVSIEEIDDLKEFDGE